MDYGRSEHVSGDGAPPASSIQFNMALGNQDVAGRDIIKITYSRSARLVPEPVPPVQDGSGGLFEPPPAYSTARSLMLGMEDAEPRSVIVLVGDRGTGRRTTAMRLLASALPTGIRIERLSADFDEADAELIPTEGPARYLLDLSAVSFRLPDSFREGLARYAVTAAERGIYMVAVVSDSAWGDVPLTMGGGALAVLRHIPAPAEKVAIRILESDQSTAERVEWLNAEGSVFRGLLHPSSVPADGVRLAAFITAAKDPFDREAADGFRGWENKVKDWFDSDGPTAIRHRVLQITASFMEGAPLEKVMAARDALLSIPELKLGTDPGGPLAGPSARTQCSQAELTVDEDGRVYLDRPRPGVRHALLRHLWKTRPEMKQIAIDWLTKITGPGGPAADRLEAIADVLAGLADVDGVDLALEQAGQWIMHGSPAQARLAVSLVERLAMHPTSSSRARTVLLDNWSTAATRAPRQRAVARICAGKFGLEQPHLALTRLRRVLDSASDAETRAAAIDAVRELANVPELSPLVVNRLAEWSRERKEHDGSRTALLDVLALPVKLSHSFNDGAREVPKQIDFLRKLLSHEGETGDDVRRLLADGLWRLVATADTASAAASLVNGLITAAEEGILPPDEVIATVSEPIEEGFKQGATNLRGLLTGSLTPLRQTLFDRGVAALEGVINIETPEIGSQAA